MKKFLLLVSIVIATVINAQEKITTSNFKTKIQKGVTVVEFNAPFNKSNNFKNWKQLEHCEYYTVCIHDSPELKKKHKEVKVCSFGHLGDGNLHYNLMDEDKNKEYVYNNQTILKELVYKKIKKFNGSFSAEHGIGQLKIKELEKYKDQNLLNLMRTIKNSVDPKNILNPGKLFT